MNILYLIVDDLSPTADELGRLTSAGQALMPPLRHEGAVTGVSFSPDGRRVLTAIRDETARVWDAATGQLRHTLTGHKTQAWGVAFSPDGRTLATGAEEGTVKLWDLGREAGK